MASLNKEILRLAVPNILSNISVPLLSTVDTALMGRTSTLHLAAVGLGSMAFSFIYWNFGFLRMGTTGITAQAYGRSDKADVFFTLWRSILIALFVALVLIIFQRPLFFSAGSLLAVDQELWHSFEEYLSIRIWAAPATLLLYVLFGWYFGLQNARLPLLITLLANIANIGLSYFFVAYQKMEITGVALGTVFGQYIGVFFLIGWSVYKYGGQVWEHFRIKEVLASDALSIFLRVQKNLFIRTVMLTLAFAYFYRFSSKSGELFLAVNVVLLQFVNWTSYGIDGFAYAAESVTGKYYGKGEKNNLLSSIRLSFGWGFLLGFLMSTCFALWRMPLLRIFSDDVQVIDTAHRFYFWILFIPFLAAASYIWDGIFVGLTASKAMRDSMFLASLSYLAVVWAGIHFVGFENQVIWLALSIFLFMRGSIQTGQFFQQKMWIIP